MRIKGLIILSSVHSLVLLFIFSALLVLPAYAEEKGTNSYVQNFLGKSEGQRVWWYMGTFMSLGHLASQTNEERGDCIYNWYFDEPEKQRQIIEETMRKFPQHLPSSVILALLYKACGKFTVEWEP